MIVDSTSHVLNSDGESVYKFNGYMSNKAVSIILSTNKVWTYDILDGAAGGENAKPYPTCLDASDIKKGCVILFYSNLKNEVELICKLFDCYSAINDAKDGIQNPYVNPYPSDRIVLFDKTIANKKYEFIFGYAYTRSSSTATLTKNNVTEPTGLSLYDYLIGPNTNVLCYDAFFGPSTKVSVGDASDIEFDKFGEGSFVFAKTCDGYLHDIINILPQW